MAWAEVRAGTPAPAVIWRVVVASYSSADRLADVWIRHTTSTLAVPSSLAWYAISSGRLGAKGVVSSLPSRPTCTWSVGGSRRVYSISTVVLVAGIRTPKWRIIARPPSNREKTPDVWPAIMAERHPCDNQRGGYRVPSCR